VNYLSSVTTPFIRDAKITVESRWLTGIEFCWGYEDRPLFQILRSLEIQDAVKWTDRFSELEALACETAFCRAIENAHSIHVSKKVQMIREFLLTFQRMQWGFQLLTNTFGCLGDKAMYESSVLLAESLRDWLEVTTGHRVLPQFLKVGGIRREFSLGELVKLGAFFSEFFPRAEQLLTDIEKDVILWERLSGLLRISCETCNQIFVMGPFVCQFGQTSDALHRIHSVIAMIRSSFKELLALHKALTLESRVESAELHSVDWPKSTVRGGAFGSSGWIEIEVSADVVRISSPSTRMRNQLEELVKGIIVNDLSLALVTLGFSLQEAELVNSKNQDIGDTLSKEYQSVGNQR